MREEGGMEGGREGGREPLRLDQSSSHTRSLLRPCRMTQDPGATSKKCVSEPSPEWRKRTQMLAFVTAPVCPDRTCHSGMTAGPHNSGQLQSPPSLSKCLDSRSTPSQIHYHTMPTCICGGASRHLRVSCVVRGKPSFMC